MNETVNACVSEDRDGYLVVCVRGEVDLSWSQQVRDAILAALGRGNAVGVELSQVLYIDSSGIAALVEGFQTARGKGKRFGLIAASAPVLAVLQLARLDKVFPLFADVDAARVG
jgi:anti-sigma B factor antagonist